MLLLLSQDELINYLVAKVILGICENEVQLGQSLQMRVLRLPGNPAEASAGKVEG